MDIKERIERTLEEWDRELTRLEDSLTGDCLTDMERVGKWLNEDALAFEHWSRWTSLGFTMSAFEVVLGVGGPTITLNGAPSTGSSVLVLNGVWGSDKANRFCWFPALFEALQAIAEDEESLAL